MKASTKWIAAMAGVALAGFTPAPSYAQTSYGSGQPANANQQTAGQTGGPNGISRLETQAQQTIAVFKQKDPSLQNFFQGSAGYAVFPTVGEGAFIVGGAHGNGVVYQNGEPIGTATLTKGSVGAQIGGQSFSEVVFFQSPQSLQQFKQGNLEFSAGANAVGANSGVGKTTNYRNGVAVFTTSRTGLMAKAAIGGQKFTFQPLAMGAAGFSGQGGTSSGGSSNPANPNKGAAH